MSITLTRHYSGFCNVADTYSLGNREHDGNASVAEYALPAGYYAADGMIRDPDGWACAIVPCGSGPVLVSLGGPQQDQRLHLIIG